MPQMYLKCISQWVEETLDTKNHWVRQSCNVAVALNCWERSTPNFEASSGSKSCHVMLSHVIYSDVTLYYMYFYVMLSIQAAVAIVKITNFFWVKTVFCRFQVRFLPHNHLRMQDHILRSRKRRAKDVGMVTTITNPWRQQLQQYNFNNLTTFFL